MCAALFVLMLLRIGLFNAHVMATCWPSRSHAAVRRTTQLVKPVNRGPLARIFTRFETLGSEAHFLTLENLPPDNYTESRLCLMRLPDEVLHWCGCNVRL